MEPFTCGPGVQVPLYVLTRLPVNINIDYTLPPQIGPARFSASPVYRLHHQARL